MSERERKRQLDALEERLTRPKRIALFGHRAVGKTTLLAMFYREASTGRVPGARLAATEAKGAEYLAEKIAQIEAGEPPAGTLTETELKLRLYRGPARLDLIVKDYQGEHITLGTEAPIQEFFADCDAVLLCLDPDGVARPAETRRRQQEIEHLLERYLERSEEGITDRPLALLVTKYDRVLARGGSAAAQEFVETQYGMTQHALACHAPRSAIFAVSSYGPDANGDGRPPAHLRPMGLEGPLGWLADQLEAVDREQLEWIWDLAPDDLPRLARCLKVYERRYPRSERLIDYRSRLKLLRRRRLGRGVLRLTGALLLGTVGLAAYDAWGFRQMLAFERADYPAPEVARRWAEFLAWHPSQPLFWPSESKSAREKFQSWQVEAARMRAAIGTASPEELQGELDQLKEQAPRQVPAILQVEATLEQMRHDTLWKQIQGEALLSSRSPEDRLESLQEFIHRNQQSPHLDAALKLADTLKQEIAERKAGFERDLIDALVRDSRLPNPDYLDLIERAGRFLDQNSTSRYRGEVEDLLDEYLARHDEQDIERARQYAKANPRNFELQVQRYQEYLRAHQDGGAYVEEAKRAIERIQRRRDTYLYRLAYDHLAAHPNDIAEVANRFKDYLAANPEGRYAHDAQRYLDWWAMIETKNEYRVTLKRGEVDPKITKSFAGGAPDLSVVIWVAGVKHGPTPVIPNSTKPIWNYTFPKPIQWKLGDPVTLQVVDHDWSDSIVATLHSPSGDPLAIRILSGTVRPAKLRDLVFLQFDSTFELPTLTKPRPEDE